MEDLTKSAVDRQNVLNNKFALEKIQEYIGLTGMVFNNEYKFTLQQIAEFYMIDRRTVIRYLNQFENELKHNGYEVLKGTKLKEFKTQFGHLLDDGEKAPQLGVFNFRSFLNLGMLLTESEKAKILRSKLLDIVIDTLNEKLGGSTKYINQRDGDFLISILKEPQYRKDFTTALNKYVDMGNFKYAYFTDKIYQSIFKENTKEYKKILFLEENENLRDTMYAEVLKTIASFETGIAYELKNESEKINRKLTQQETEALFDKFALHPAHHPHIEDARIKMASRDYGFRNILHEKIAAYLQGVPQSDYERFLGEKSKAIDKRIEESKDVFIRLKNR
jgi:predicted SprT family Zn-dependent metalloprotease